MYFWGALSAQEYKPVYDDKQFSSELIRHMYVTYSIERRIPVDTLVRRGDEGGMSVLYEVPGTLPGLIKVVSVQNEITHIGLHVFTVEELDGYAPFAPFFEQHLLKIHDQAQPADGAWDAVDTDELVINLNGTILKDISPGSTELSTLLKTLEARRVCNLTFGNSMYQCACETSTGDRLRISVRADIELLSNMDRNELQERLINDIRAVKGGEPFSMDCVIPPEMSQLIAHNARGVYRTSGDSLLPGLRSEYYFIKEGLSNEFRLVDAGDHSLEAISNMFTCPRESETKILVSQKMYGDRTESAEVRLNELLRIFGRDHDIFVGFEQKESGQIDAAVVLRSPAYTYQHLLVVHDVEQMIFLNQTEPLYGNLYSFIPFGNVKELFGTHVERNRGKISVDINN